MQAEGLNNSMAGFSDMSGLKDNLDMIREMLYDNDPIFVGITLTVSFLHTIFEFMALKNDIQYWRNLDQYTGLSVKSLYTSFVTEIIITLWLFDT
jgi:hypothetical protein